MAFQHNIFFNATNRPGNQIQDYILVDARLTWANAADDLEIAAEVTTLFDKYTC
jgi:outer membrane receptor for ferrienterochelin and colicin